MLEQKDSPWRDLGNDAHTYWTEYGGIRRFLASPYLHLALFLTIISWRYWLSGTWSDLAIAVLPPLLGFALASYALLLAFGEEDFRRFMAMPTPDDYADENGPSTSKLLILSATFMHFLFVQVIALLLVIIAKAHVLTSLQVLFPTILRSGTYPINILYVAHVVFSATAYCAFSLSATTSLAAAFAIFNSTHWYVEYIKRKPLP